MDLTLEDISDRNFASLDEALLLYRSFLPPDSTLQWSYQRTSPDGSRLDRALFNRKLCLRASKTLLAPHPQDWKAVIECTSIRGLWDRCVEKCTLLETVDQHTKLTRTTLKSGWPKSPRDLVMIESTFTEDSSILHIATSIPTSPDDPAFLRTPPPHVLAHVDLTAWHIEALPTPPSSSSTNHDNAYQAIRVTHYFCCDQNWARTSSYAGSAPLRIDQIENYLATCSVPPSIVRVDCGIQLDADEYDPISESLQCKYSILDSALIGTECGGNEMDESSEMREDESPADEKLASFDVQAATRKWCCGRNIELFVHVIENFPSVSYPASSSANSKDHKSLTSGQLDTLDKAVGCYVYPDSGRFVFRIRYPRPPRNSGGVFNVQLRICRGKECEKDGRRVYVNGMEKEQVNAFLGGKENDPPDIVLVDSELEEENHGEAKVSQDVFEDDDGDDSFCEERPRTRYSQLERCSPISSRYRSHPARGSFRDRSSSAPAPSFFLPSTFKIPPSRTSTSSISASLRQFTPSPNRSSSSLSNTRPRHSASRFEIRTPPIIPLTVPSQLHQTFALFDSLFSSDPITSSIKPNSEGEAANWKNFGTTRRGVGIFQYPIPGHPTGVLKGVGVFERVGLWDMIAVIECSGARRIWDRMFDDAVVLDTVGSNCVLSINRLKSLWLSSPRDFAVLSCTTHTSPSSIIYISSSVPDAFPGIPPPQSNHVRARLELSGWHISQSISTGTPDPSITTRIVYIVKSDPRGWIPTSLLNTVIREEPLKVANVLDYYELFGAPPRLQYCRNGQVTAKNYDHQRSSFMVKYRLRDRRVSKKRNGDGDEAEDIEPNKGDAAPTNKIELLLRIDARKWGNPSVSVAVLPPANDFIAFRDRANDPTGIRLLLIHKLAITAGANQPTVTLHVRKGDGGDVKDVNGSSAPRIVAYTETAFVVLNGISVPVRDRPPDGVMDLSDVSEEAMKGTSVVNSSKIVTSQTELREDSHSKDAASASVDSATTPDSVPPPTKRPITSLATFMTRNKRKPERDSAVADSDRPSAASTGQKPRASEPNLTVLTSTRPQSRSESQTPQSTFSHLSPSETTTPARSAPVETTVESNRNSLEPSPMTLNAASTTATPTTTKPNAATRTADPPPQFEPEFKIARQSLKILKRLYWEKNSGWTQVLSNKTGLEVQRRYVPEVSTDLPVMRGAKVVEGFEVHEVAATVASIGCRLVWDEMLEGGVLVGVLANGCTTVQSQLKGTFPLKGRELFTVDCCECSRTASSPSTTPAVYFVSCSIPGSTTIFATETKPRANLLMYGWILDPVDPYGSDSHPIPSTKVTTFSSLDQCGSVPNVLSAMIASGLPRNICNVEEYLKYFGPPPYVIAPARMLPEGEITSTLGAYNSTTGMNLVAANIVNPAYLVVCEDFDHSTGTYLVVVEYSVELAMEATTIADEPSNEETLIDAPGALDPEMIITDILVDLRRYAAGYTVDTLVRRQESETRQNLSSGSSTCSARSAASSISLTDRISRVAVRIFDIPPAAGHTSALSSGADRPCKHLLRVLHSKADGPQHKKSGSDEKCGAEDDAVSVHDAREIDDGKIYLEIRLAPIQPTASEESGESGISAGDVQAGDRNRKGGDGVQVPCRVWVNCVPSDVLPGKREWAQVDYGNVGREKCRTLPAMKTTVRPPSPLKVLEIARSGHNEGHHRDPVRTGHGNSEHHGRDLYPYRRLHSSQAPWIRNRLYYCTELVGHAWTTCRFEWPQVVLVAVLSFLLGAVVRLMLTDGAKIRPSETGSGCVSSEQLHYVGRVLGREILLRLRR